MLLTTDRIDNGLRRTTAATSGTAEDRTPETQNELTCSECSRYSKRVRSLRKIHTSLTAYS